MPLRISFEEDLARVRAAREAVGGDRNLMVDANTSLSSRMAMRYAEALEPLNVRWFEEPTQPEDVEGCAELARRTRIPIAGFETEIRQVPVCAADRCRRGPGGRSSTSSRSAASPRPARSRAYAQMRHLPVTAKNYSTAVSTAATLQLLFALPNGDYFECDQDPNALRDGITRGSLFSLDDGMVMANEGAGLGLEIDETALRRWRV